MMANGEYRLFNLIVSWKDLAGAEHKKALTNENRKTKEVNVLKNFFFLQLKLQWKFTIEKCKRVAW